MTYVRDSNAVIALTGGDRAVRACNRAALAQGNVVAISSIVAFDLWYGVFLSQRRDQNVASLRAFFSERIPVLAFDDEDAVTAAEIRAYLKAGGTPIGPYDVLIAAQALRRDATLVTANLGEYSRVPGLKCVNWEEGA